MARVSKSMSFKNAEIDLETLTLTEYNKDDTSEFNIMDILKEWDKTSGISITIKKDDDFTAPEDGEDS